MKLPKWIRRLLWNGEGACPLCGVRLQAKQEEREGLTTEVVSSGSSASFEVVEGEDGRTAFVIRRN